MKRFKRSGYNLVIIVSIALIEILLFTGSKALMNVMKSVSYFEFYFSFDNGHAMTCHTSTFSVVIGLFGESAANLTYTLPII